MNIFRTLAASSKVPAFKIMKLMITKVFPKIAFINTPWAKMAFNQAYKFAEPYIEGTVKKTYYAYTPESVQSMVNGSSVLIKHYKEEIKNVDYTYLKYGYIAVTTVYGAYQGYNLVKALSENAYGIPLLKNPTFGLKEHYPALNKVKAVLSSILLIPSSINFLKPSATMVVYNKYYQNNVDKSFKFLKLLTGLSTTIAFAGAGNYLFNDGKKELEVYSLSLKLKTNTTISLNDHDFHIDIDRNITFSIPIPDNFVDGAKVAGMAVLGAVYGFQIGKNIPYYHAHYFDSKISNQLYPTWLRIGGANTINKAIDFITDIPRFFLCLPSTMAMGCRGTYLYEYWESPSKIDIAATMGGGVLGALLGVGTLPFLPITNKEKDVAVSASEGETCSDWLPPLIADDCNASLIGEGNSDSL